MPVDYDPEEGAIEGVYKVFSTEPLTEEQKNYLFETHSETATVDWKAYPQYRFEEFITLPYQLSHNGLVHNLYIRYLSVVGHGWCIVYIMHTDCLRLCYDVLSSTNLWKCSRFRRYSFQAARHSWIFRSE